MARTQNEDEGPERIDVVPSINEDVWNAAINEWLGNDMRNSAMSHSTEAWNHLVASLPNLKKLLESKL